MSIVLLLALAGAAVGALASVPVGKLQAATPRASAEPLQVRFTDRQFWAFVTDWSEPTGSFHSENLVSNEALFQQIMPRIKELAVPGRAYVGVGSEQNFTYIAALHPSVAFIVDLRRGNLDLHLIYKTAFETSADRADFVSKLFSRPRPAGLSASSTAKQIFDAFETAAPSEALFDKNLKAIETHLSTKHGFSLLDADREGIRFVYKSWFDEGPDIRYELTGRGGPGPGVGGGRGFGGRRGPAGLPTYADLMTADDGTGKNWSYLANEENFKVMKDLETRNMVVPVVGNFAGPKALRAVATYLKQHAQIVSAFYLSNVEQYLRQDGLWEPFCANAATLPFDAKSVFIRSNRGGNAVFDLGVAPMAPEVKSCGK